MILYVILPLILRLHPFQVYPKHTDKTNIFVVPQVRNPLTKILFNKI